MIIEEKIKSEDYCIFEDEYGNPDLDHVNNYKNKDQTKYKLIKSGFKSSEDLHEWMNENLKPLWAIYDEDGVYYKSGWYGRNGNPEFTRFSGWWRNDPCRVVKSGIETEEEADKLTKKLNDERWYFYHEHEFDERQFL